uniref:KDP operon transcriptional regulatory protein kdpE n=1 Tax=mine drainage metagenome TaxID=410659 RepID=E6PUG8_9ZZZZ
MARGLIDAGTRKPDLVILDLGLPDGDGIDFIRDFRGWSGAPLIVLSARSAEAAKVAALDQGADDDLGKPFGVAELLARVRAPALRPRGAGHGAAPGEPRRRRPAPDRDGVPPAVRPGQPPRPGADPPPAAARSLGAGLCGAWPLPAHRHGPPAPQAEDDPARPRHLLTEVGVGYRFMAD